MTPEGIPSRPVIVTMTYNFESSTNKNPVPSRIKGGLTLFARRLGEPWVSHNRDEILKGIPEHIDGASILDVGCADGGYLQLLSQRFNTYLVIGIDSSLEELRLANTLRPSSASSLVCADALALPIKAERFDLIFLKDLLHHTDHPVKVLNECERVLTKEGTVIIAETERDNRIMRVYSKYGHNHFTLNQLLTIVGKAGLETESVERISAYAHHLLLQPSSPRELLWDIASAILLSICHFRPQASAVLLRMLSAIAPHSYNIVLCQKERSYY